MACSEQSMQIENDFLYQLRDYRTMVRDGDRLLLIGQDREVLSFSQRIKAGTP
jgi:heat shock protein HslJ